MGERCTATVSDIASALGITDRAVRKRAKVWQPTGERVQGGGDTYDIDTLQLRKGEVAKIKKHLARQGVTTQPFPEPVDLQQKQHNRLQARAQSVQMFDRLPEAKQLSAKAKIAVIRACALYIQEGRLAKSLGQESFVHDYNLGLDCVPSWVRDEIRTVHVATLRAWITQERELGITGLVDLYGNRKGQSKIDTCITGYDADGTPVQPLVNAVKAVMFKYPHLRYKAKLVNESIRALAPDAPHVSDKSVGRWMEAWISANADAWELITNPDKYKNNRQAAFGSRSEGITALNQVWETDATPADLLLTNGRHKILGIIDVYSRRLKFLVSQTERAVDNCALFRRGLVAWGVPQQLTVDNGTPYQAEHTQRVLSDLDIHVHTCKPFSGDEKPHIERAFKTFSHDLVELLTGYCGHSVADRKDIEARKSFAKRLFTQGEVIEVAMSSIELQRLCDDWCEAYHHNVHSSLGKTPFQMVAEWTDPVRVITDERALDVLLSTAPKGGLRTITKKGIRVDRYTFIHADLAIHVGKQARVLYESEEQGQIIVQIRNECEAWEHLCVALCPELTGISRAEVAAVAKARQNEHKAEIQRHTREAKKALKGVDIARAVLDKRLEKNANVTMLPRATVEHTTPGLQAAGYAAAHLAGAPAALKPQPVNPEIAAMKKRITEELAAPNKITNLQIESEKQRYKRFRAMRARLTNEEEVSPEDYQALLVYEKSHEYKAFKMVEEDLGTIGGLRGK